jgi:hypothetical protein
MLLFTRPRVDTLTSILVLGKGRKPSGKDGGGYDIRYTKGTAEPDGYTGWVATRRFWYGLVLRDCDCDSSILMIPTLWDMLHTLATGRDWAVGLDFWAFCI